MIMDELFMQGDLWESHQFGGIHFDIEEGGILVAATALKSNGIGTGRHSPEKVLTIPEGDCV
jgi:hypothetical protein